MDFDCWAWGGAHNAWDGRPMKGSKYAAREIYQSYFGPVPDDMDCHHKCFDLKCVNPWHIEVLTKQEHRARHRRTHCRRGHELTPENLEAGVRCRICAKETRRKYSKTYRRKRKLIDRA